MNDTKSSIKIVIGVVIFLIIVSGITLIPNKIKQNPAGTIGNTAGNLNNNGLYCEDDGIVYFANAYSGGSLYSMNADESDIKQITDAKVKYINAAGKYLYYYQTGSGISSGLGSLRSVSGVYRSGKKRGSSTCIKRDPSGILSLIDNDLYYQHYDTKNGMSLYRTSTDKSEEAEISKLAINPASSQNGIIYYNGLEKDHYLYAYDTATDSVSTVWEYNLWNPVVQGDLVYFMDVNNDYRLCCYSLSSGEMKILSEDRIDYFNVSGTFVYYQKSSADEPALKRLGTDGAGNVTSEEVVAEGVYENINITSNFVYFQRFKETVPVYKTSTTGPVNVTTFDAARDAVMTES